MLVVLLLVLIPLGVSNAHGTGFTIEEEVGDTLVDIGFSAERLLVDRAIRLDFLLFDIVSGREIEYDDVWVRIERDDQLLYAGGVARQRFGATGMSYRFPEPGTHELYVRFQVDGERVSELTTQFSVEQPEPRTVVERYGLDVRSVTIGALASVAILTFLGVFSWVGWYLVRTFKRRSSNRRTE